VTWDSESWNKSAHSYHAARRGTGAVLSVETEPEKLRRLRRLLADNVSLDRAYAEFNKPLSTPKTTIEAILHCVRERGVAALKEPTNLERLTRCDAAAQAEISRRIAKLKKGSAP
jgi:hypothetical protein